MYFFLKDNLSFWLRYLRERYYCFIYLFNRDSVPDLAKSLACKILQ